MLLVVAFFEPLFTWTIAALPPEAATSAIMPCAAVSRNFTSDRLAHAPVVVPGVNCQRRFASVQLTFRFHTMTRLLDCSVMAR